MEWAILEGMYLRIKLTNMKNKLTLFLGLLIVFVFSAFAKDDPITELLKKLEEFTKKYPQEKIHLHLDKPYYAIGDDIWFNAYVINTKTGTPTQISNIIYIELINERDTLIKQLKIPMKSGIAWGDFKLTDNLNDGNYRIRAYTQWMRNAGAEFFFDKVIKVGSSWANQVNTEVSVQLNDQNQTHSIKFSSKSKTPLINRPVSYTIELTDQKFIKGKTTTDNNGEIKITTPNNAQGGKIITEIVLADKTTAVKTIPIKLFTSQTDVQFFAESGNLIENLPSKLAIKAVNRNGLGENISGTITDNDGIEILSFETTHLGMGSFALTPMEGKTYKANVKFADGTSRIFDLPKPEKSGYVLSVNNTDTAKIYIRVMLSVDRLNQGELSLIAQRNGNVFSLTKLPSTKQITNVVLNKNEISSGLVQITLFNAQSTPVAERLAFINNKSDKIDVGIQNLNPTYSKKGNVNLTLSANNNSKTVQGSFSVAVTNADIVTPDAASESNILTGLLLTSDLIGYVEKPNHYFLKDDVQTRIELDNLLLTQGWRKINWKDMVSEPSFEVKYPAEKSLKISGTVTTNSNKPIANGKIALISSTKGNFVTTTETDVNGRFIFDEMSFGDSLKFVVQASTKEDKKNVRVKIDIVPEQTVTVNKNTGDIEVNVNTKLNKYLQESDRFFEEQLKSGFLTRTNILKTVTITQNVKKKEDSAAAYSANYNGRGRADKIITAKDLENAYSLSQYIAQGRIMGVADSGGFAWNTRIGSSPTPDPDDPGKPSEVPKMAIVLDGMLLQDFSLEEIQVNEVESIEVLLSPGYTTAYGSSGKNGLLVISLKRGSGRKISDINSPGLAILSPKGYDVPRQFYSPKYDNTSENKTDLRTTVYWNPQIVTDTNGKANFSFYNTDQSGNYRMVIEGIDADGNLARKVFMYKIN
ncbi:carboxypeptidase regulatory-like domain-containing protein [Pedobacter cryotolerans]|uniref:Carboxypeptidase regulatory-like domain-containing protein n=2 Tax=Pedobacter cryotolerans TaxID=2571270 RepID=A0A4V5NYE2_9SPHI|nr:carboxypeptidase regulatory-like domain-containing protein [Pedobacter cryotolerans]